jgi:phenylpyruvate tautomerase PptA (4-oxalocrotonate tautomerase family)
MIRVKLTDDVFAPEQKRKVIAELTRVIVSVKGKQPVTLVVIEEDAPEADVVFC